jgi:hypothetical protein
LWGLTLERLRGEGVPIAAVNAALCGIPWQKQIDGSGITHWASGTIKCSLHTAYTLDQDTHDFVNDVSGIEVAASGGYTASGNHARIQDVKLHVGNGPDLA